MSDSNSSPSITLDATLFQNNWYFFIDLNDGNFWLDRTQTHFLHFLAAMTLSSRKGNKLLFLIFFWILSFLSEHPSWHESSFIIRIQLIKKQQLVSIAWKNTSFFIFIFVPMMICTISLDIFVCTKFVRDLKSNSSLSAFVIIDD